MTREEACAILGVRATATAAEARRAYRSLARAFHPDKGGDVARFQAVQRAHERLEAGEARTRARHRARPEAPRRALPAPLGVDDARTPGRVPPRS